MSPGNGLCSEGPSHLNVNENIDTPVFSLTLRASERPGGSDWCEIICLASSMEPAIDTALSF